MKHLPHELHSPPAMWALLGAVLFPIAMLLPGTQIILTNAVYLPLHMAMEAFTVFVASMIFLQSWISRRQRAVNDVVLGCGFLAVGLLDFSHLLSYPGMPAFVTASDAEKAISFWLAARAIAALTLLAIGAGWPARVITQTPLPIAPAAGVALTVTALVSWLVLQRPDLLRPTFVPGSGLTAFKIGAEIVIVLATLAAAALLYRLYRSERTLWLGYLAAAAWLTALGEVFFTVYAHVSDLYNLLGHLFKVSAYALILRAQLLRLVENPISTAELRWQFALEGGSQGVWDDDLTTGKVYYSPQWKAMLGFAADELGDDLATWQERIHPDDAAMVAAAMRRYVDGEDAQYETQHRLRTRDGGWIWVLSRGRILARLPDGSAKRIVGTHTDITAQKQSEERAQQTARCTAALLELRQAADRFNRGDYLRHALAIAEELTDSHLSFLHLVGNDRKSVELLACSAPGRQRNGSADPPPAPAAILAQALRQGKAMVVNDGAACAGGNGLPAGDATLQRLISMPVIEQGQAVLLITVANKATDYDACEVETLQLLANEIWHVVRMERSFAALQESEERFRRLFEQTQEPLTLNEDGCFVAANAAALAMMRCSSAEQLIGKTVIDISPPQQPDGQPSATKATAIRERAFAEGSLRFEWQHQRADGTPLVVEVLTTVLNHWGKQILYSSWTDITDRKAQELRLQSTLRTLEIATEVAELGIWVWDVVADSLTWDKRMFDIYGVPPELRRSALHYAFWADRVHPLDLPMAEAALEAERNGTGIYDPIFRIILPDGSVRHVQAAAFIEREASGSVTRIVGINRDITRLRENEQALATYREHLEDVVSIRTAEAEAAQRRTQLILDSSADGLIGLDPEGCVTLCNQAALNMLGYRLQDLLGRNVHDAIHYQHADGRPYYADECVVVQAIRDGRASRSDHETFWDAHGKPVPVFVATHPIIEHGRPVGGVMNFHDISDRLVAETAREEARAAAERLARMKSEFLANMSHEIRTPLNGVLGLAQIGYRESPEHGKARHTFKEILNSGKLLLTVINDILDFSKIEAGKLEIESVPLDPGQLAEDVAQSVRFLAEAKDLGLFIERAELPATCVGDPVRISQILLNLLSNAIKFTLAGEVRLRVRHEHGALIFTIRDTGIGIAPDVVARLFRPFEQADNSTTRRFGGTGLGLAISRRLAELMGGSLSVVSSQGEGSTFTLRLPLRETASQLASATRAIIPGSRRLTGFRLLVAEDNAINRLVLEDLLLGEGAEVVLAENGQQAIEAVEEAPTRFDAVLMDVQMPVIDGLEATRILRKLHPELPIIGQTAHALKEEHDKCLDAGMLATINKPVDTEILVSVLWERMQAAAPADNGAPPAGDALAVDWEALLRTYQNRLELVDRVLVLTLQRHAGDGAQLRALAAAQDIAGIERLAHALKGVGGNVCAPELQHLALQTMISARALDTKAFLQAQTLADAVERMLDVFRRGRAH